MDSFKSRREVRTLKTINYRNFLCRKPVLPVAATRLDKVVNRFLIHHDGLDVGRYVRTLCFRPYDNAPDRVVQFRAHDHACDYAENESDK